MVEFEKVQKRQISSFSCVTKWMDSWPAQDKTKTQSCHLKQKEEHACRDVLCVLPVPIYRIFVDFLALLTHKTHLSPNS